LLLTTRPAAGRPAQAQLEKKLAPEVFEPIAKASTIHGGQLIVDPRRGFNPAVDAGLGSLGLTEDRSTL